MDLALRRSFISSKDFKQRVDLGDFIAGPFPGKRFPPSAIILSQHARIIKKRNCLSADSADFKILFSGGSRGGKMGGIGG
jgi:hypothetical protein